MTTQLLFQPVTCAELAVMEFPPPSPEPTPPPAWDDLVRAEPELAEVERLALSLYHKSGGQDVRDWSRVKRAFLPLVGFDARRYTLRSPAAYNVAYDHVLACWERGRRPKG